MADQQVDFRTKAAGSCDRPAADARNRPAEAGSVFARIERAAADHRESGARAASGDGSCCLSCCAVVAGTGVAVWRWWDRSDAGKVDPATTTTQVVRRDFSSSVLATGAVKPQVGAQVRVGARVSGKVEKLRANIGDSVRAGQVIAELEKADLQATVGQRQAELDLAKAKLAAVESLLPQQIEKAEADCDRWEASLARTSRKGSGQKSLRPMKAIAETDYDMAVVQLRNGQGSIGLRTEVLRFGQDPICRGSQAGRRPISPGPSRH